MVVGLAAIGFTAGLAGLASRHGVVSPGGSVAAGVVLAMIGPVIVGAFLGWDSIYPIGDFSAGVVTFWLGVAGAGALACGAALRPGVGA